MGRLAAACVALVLQVATRDLAAAPNETQLDSARRVVDDEQLRVTQGGYGHPYAALALGRGLRTNNPYRLEHVVGDSPEGLSLSALYLDIGGGWLLGDPLRIEHGPSVHLSVALTGIRQEVLSPGYRALVRMGSRWSASARLGVPVVLEPDLGGGVELGVSGILRLLAGVAAYAELIQSVFFGAATYDVDTTIVPIVSLQLGLWVDYEVLP